MRERVELAEIADRSVLRAVLDDLSRPVGPDPLDTPQFLDIRNIDVDLLGRRRPRRVGRTRNSGIRLPLQELVRRPVPDTRDTAEIVDRRTPTVRVATT